MAYSRSENTLSSVSSPLSQIPQALIMWKAAIYIRLSKDDGDKQESNSVTNQREILKEHLKLHPDIELYDIYIDDGWSGTNFDRPSFLRMMEDIYSGKVNCVIVKDLSRFCRNASEGGQYLDNVFVRYRVRFIAINNGIDTASNNMNAATQCISVGVTKVINESVAATTSVNVRGTLNVNLQQGKFIGSFATYGYLKDPNDHHKLIIDEETAPIVRLIFEKFLEGVSIIGIAKLLNGMGIPNPSTYKKIKGFNYRHPIGSSNDGLWPDTSVRSILKNEMYIGNMVQGRNTTVSYKIKQCRAIPKEKWIIVKGTHDPIIDEETFRKVQSIFNRNTRATPDTKNLHLFAGFVRCSDCKRVMNRKTNQHPYGTYRYYRCSTARKMSKGACTNHSIRADKMEQAVLVLLQTTINTAIEFDELLKKINANSGRKKECSHLQQTLKTQQAEREKCMRAMVDLYPDWKCGIISQEEYLSIKASLQEKVASLDTMISNLEKSVQEYTAGITSENEFISHFLKYKNFTHLTRPMLIELIENIYVFEGGKIEIELKYRDAYEQVVQYIEMNKEFTESA